MDRNFGGVIWTNHALDRLSERGIKQGDAFVAFQYPDNSRFASTKNAWVFYKTWGEQTIEVVAAQNERKEWVIMSVWSRFTDKNNFRQIKGDSFLTLLIKFIRRHRK